MLGPLSSRDTAVRIVNAAGFEPRLRFIESPQSQGHKARRPTRPQCLRAFTTQQASGGSARSVVALSVAAQALPNPSLERTSTGLALGPRTGQCHHPLRGPSANPVVSAQLKR